jgi:hypothetical protein
VDGTWLTTIAPRRIPQSTLESTYAPKVRNWIIPGLGRHRLDRLTPEHVERFYTRLEAQGLAPATVLQIRRVLSRALKVAMQRGYVGQNVATLVDAPSVNQGEVEPLTLDEAQRIIEQAAGRRYGTRWSVAWHLACGKVRRWGCAGGMLTSKPEHLPSAGSFRNWPGGMTAPIRMRAAKTATVRTVRPAAPVTHVRARNGPAAGCASRS